MSIHLQTLTMCLCARLQGSQRTASQGPRAILHTEVESLACPGPAGTDAVVSDVASLPATCYPSFPSWDPWVFQILSNHTAAEIHSQNLVMDDFWNSPHVVEGLA